MSGKTPSVGRIVHYTPLEDALGEAVAPIAAIVTSVHTPVPGDGEQTVTLTLFHKTFVDTRSAIAFTEAEAGTEEARGRWAWPRYVP